MIPARVGADVGGTFTDVLLQRSDGTISLRKVLSTPPHYDRAVVAGACDLLPDAAERMAEVVHATTVATNAVLERELGAVASDVRNEKVSRAQAQERYGVVLRDDGSPDAKQSVALRARLRITTKEEVV